MWMQGQPSNPVAWCTNYLHKGGMSLRMMRNHECRKKQCPYLKVNEDHPWWIEKKKRKAKQWKRKQKSEHTESDLLDS